MAQDSEARKRVRSVIHMLHPIMLSCMFWAARALHWYIQWFQPIPFSTWTQVVFRSRARARYTDGGRGYCSRRHGGHKIRSTSSAVTRVIEDTNEDCQSVPDAIHWRGEGQKTINSKEHWMIHVSTSAWDGCQQFKLYVHRWWQWGVGWRTDVKVQILSAWVLKRDTDIEEESRWGNRWDFQGVVSDRTTCTKWRIGVTSRRSEGARGASECGEGNRRVRRDGVDNSELASWWVEVKCVQGWPRGGNCKCEVRWRHYQEGDGVQECEHRQQFEGDIRRILARREQEQCHSHGWNACRIPRSSQQVRRCPTLIEALCTADSGAACRSAEGHPHSRAVAATLSREFAVTQWSTVCQTFSLEFERLRKQAKIAERLSKERVSNACQKSPTHRCITSTRTARRRHRLSKFHSNCTRGMNVDVLVIWRHTDGAASRTGPSVMHEWKETLSSHNDMCQRFEGYRSQYSDNYNDASEVIRTPWRVHSGKTGAEESEDTVEATVRSRRCCWVRAE